MKKTIKFARQFRLCIFFFTILSTISFAQSAVIEWDKAFGGNNDDISRTIIKTSDNGYLLTGYSYSNISYDKSENPRGGSDYWILKMDASGNKIWDRTFGGSALDFLQTAIQTLDGGFLLGGDSRSNISGDKSEDSRGPDYDYWIVKIDANGNKVWDKTLGGTGGDYCKSIVQTNDGGYLIGGWSSSSISGEKSEAPRGGNDYWIVKIDGSGNKEWDKTIGGNNSDNCYTIIQIDGGFLLGGYSNSSVSGEKSENSRGNYDYWIVKIDELGNKIWDKTFGGNSTDFCFSMIQNDEGKYIIAGASQSNISGEKSESSRGGKDFWIVKIDVNGNKIWDKTFGGNFTDNCYSISQTIDGGYFLGGISQSTIISGEKSEIGRGDYDFWTVKVDATGNKIWDKTIGGSAYDASLSAVEVSGGEYLMFGFSGSIVSGDKTQDLKGGKDYWIIKLMEEIANQPPLAVCQDFIIPANADCEANAVPEDVDNGSTDPDGDPLILSLSPLGPYPLGATLVTLTVDDGQVTDQCTAMITVIDETPPSITCPENISVNVAQGACDAVVNFNVTATDNCGNVTTVCSPTSGSTFFLGTTTVNCTATDVAGNETTCSFDITVTGGTGTISGTTTVNGDGLAGVTVKLLDDAEPTIVVDETTTDSQGAYSFDNFTVGIYQVMIVEPLGYTVNQNFITTSLVCGATNTVDFIFTEIVLVNEARSKGYWKHQFDVYVKNRGNAQETATQLQDYIDLVQERYTPHFDFYAALISFEDWQDALSVKGNAGMEAKAKSQLAALVLNIVSLKIGQYEVVTVDGKTAADVLTYVSELLDDGDPANDELAKDLAEQVNLQETIEAGLVTPSQNILYKMAQKNLTVPDNYSLDQNFPNPFNPSTTIKYSIKEDNFVSLKVYNILGIEMATLVNEEKAAGIYTLTFDDSKLSSGVYLYTIKAGSFTDTKKMVLLR